MVEVTRDDAAIAALAPAYGSTIEIVVATGEAVAATPLDGTL